MVFLRKGAVEIAPADAELNGFNLSNMADSDHMRLEHTSVRCQIDHHVL